MRFIWTDLFRFLNERDLAQSGILARFGKIDSSSNVVP